MSDTQPLTVPPAGWYPDRNEANLVRWWDGSQWTDQTQSTAPAASAFEQPVSIAAFAPQTVGVTPQTVPAQATAAQATPAQATPAQAHQIVPGWYPDNRDTSLVRWWDGTQWTAQTMPAAPSGQSMPRGDLYGTAVQPVSSPNNTMATLSLILSVASFAGLLVPWLLLLALAGIIVGIVALRRARLFVPNRRRRGQAVAGVIVGAVSLVMTVLLTIAAVFVYQQAHGTTPVQSGGQLGSQAAGGTGSDGTGSNGTGGVFFPSTVAELKQVIAKSVGRQDSVVVTTVTCDAAASMVAGSTFDCGALAADGRWSPVRVNIMAPAESGMAYDLGYGPLLAADAAATPIQYTVDQIERELNVNLAQAWKSTVTAVDCDASASTAQGSRFRCSISLEGSRVGIVRIDIVPPGGYDVTVLTPPTATNGAGGSGGTDDSTGTDPDLSHS